MFIINDRGPVPDSDLLEMLKKVETATVGHFRHFGFMHPGLRPLAKRPHVVGPAMTVKTPGADSTVVHKVMEMVQPGDVVVVDRCGDTLHACWGGVVTLAARLKGVAGAVIDGPATDADEIKEIGLPVYCRGISAITTKLLGLAGEINTAVQCGGVSVQPGDLILADANGVLVLRPSEAAAVAQEALARQESEKKLLAGLKAGKDLPALTRANSLIAEKGFKKS